jgi:hypothetical protein
MTKVKQQSNNPKCCSSAIYSFIGSFLGKKKGYSIVKDSPSFVITTVNPPKEKILKKNQIPKTEREYKQYHFKGEIILVANDNLRFQEWLRQVEIIEIN